MFHDVALLLKAIPCLEQVDKSAGLTLLEAIPARHLVISVPAQSLGGRRKGMPAHYAQHLSELIAGKPWDVREIALQTELVYVVRKG